VAVLASIAVLCWWRSRPLRRERVATQAIAESEAFWAQPGADEIARQMRRRNADRHAAFLLFGHPLAKALAARNDKLARARQEPK
jgi:hypothetical protein